MASGKPAALAARRPPRHATAQDATAMRSQVSRWAIVGLLCFASVGCKSSAFNWPWSSKKQTGLPPYSQASSTPPAAASLPSQGATPAVPNSGSPYAQTASNPYGSPPPTSAPTAGSMNPYGPNPAAATPYGSSPYGPSTPPTGAQPGGYPTSTYPGQPTSYNNPSAAANPWAGSTAAGGYTNTTSNPYVSGPAPTAPQSGPYNTTYPGSAGGATSNPYGGSGYGASTPASPPPSAPPQTDNRYGTPTTANDPTQTQRYPQYAESVRTANAPRYGTGSYDSATAPTTAPASPTGYQPANTGYNPGATNYQPGNTGYQPAGTTPYSAPTGPYQPGSTRGKELVPTSTSQATPTTGANTSNVQQVNYEAPVGGAPGAVQPASLPASNATPASSPAPVATPGNLNSIGSTAPAQDARYADYYASRSQSAQAAAPAGPMPAVVAPVYGR